MKIPNSRISATAENNASFTRYEPAYFAPFYRRVWGIRLQAEKLKIDPLGEEAHEDVRYHNIDSIDAEARLLQSRFGREFFDAIFPDGINDLKIAIEREIRKDIERVQVAKATSSIPHASYLEFGLSDLTRPEDPALIDTEHVRKDKNDSIDRYNRDCASLALSLQRLGFADRKSCIGADIMKLCEAGVSPTVALRLSSKTEVTNEPVAHANAKRNS